MEEEQYYDLVFPPGTPRTIIREIINSFDVELVERGEQLHLQTWMEMSGT